MTTTIDFAALTFALAVLVISSIALMLKLMIFALAIDDWWELKSVPKSNPERMVADDEAYASTGRVVSVMITVLIGLIWVLVVLDIAPVAWLRVVLALGILLQALIAVWQGARATMHRRRMALVLNRSRRPVGPPPVPVYQRKDSD